MRKRGAPSRRRSHPGSKFLCQFCATPAILAAAGAALCAQQPLVAPSANSNPAPTTSPARSAAAASTPQGPIAIVPADVAASVEGASQVTMGKAIITTSGTVTSGTRTTDVLLPRRGTLHVCASTTVHLSTDKSVPANETPGLMLALDHGAIETSFAIGSNSDILLTPDFRILLGGPGSSEVKVRLGEHGDTCVDNPGANAPYILVSSVFGGGAYRVQPGQRVMFQHGNLNEVVDQEKEPCGCPAPQHPETNEFPLAQSAGLAPLPPPAPSPAQPAPATPASPKPGDKTLNEPLVYSAAPAPPAATPPPPVAEPAQAPAAPTVATPSAPVSRKAAEKKPGFFHSIGRFFKRVFGAE